MNTYHDAVPFILPKHQPDRHWEQMLDTAQPDAEVSFHEGGESFSLVGRSLSLFRLRSKHEEAGKVISAEQADQLVKAARAVR